MTRRSSPPPARADAPYLRQIASLPESMNGHGHPFDIPAFRHGIDIALDTRVTFFVGENGSGKSTLLEAIAEICGFHPEGGSRDHYRESFVERSELAKALRLSWSRKTADGFFMRAESFFNFASYLETVSTFRAYGGKSLHAQSHGESFFALFDNRFEHGLYLLDEPEAALSPQRQLSFLRIIHDLAAGGHAQFVIASHSPILLAYPGGKLYAFSNDGIRETAYRDTDHYLVTRDFLNAPERFLRHLLADDSGDQGES